MLNATQCRALAKEYKNGAREAGVSKDRAFLMNNIARSLTGLATQLDMLAAKMREEARLDPSAVAPIYRTRDGTRC
jgi:hypothetical protein